ncbi:Piso0_004391 [Millerozyma farinosa CBS 7064]|uniref:Golgi apparatus membrane protein TVP38 n=1 Tax=Pichia sorbitophila (strain ATCC MYA-4447 / BCRC 22081 / CBS 7064 / NBRC 10061 / NRRL Y-12695) TaxID=559304 RepID=G8Y8N9_PICSO|nr:Piso0_004391 [Millerozyma farinosa CBS 7064]CCE84834.1 Piso0_004391 [Millerozyma farinosa CBS 7064]
MVQLPTFQGRENDLHIGGSYADIVRNIGSDITASAMQSREWFMRQSRVRKIGLAAVAVLGMSLGVVMLVFHNAVVHKLVQASDKWHSLSHGKLLLFTLVFFVGFPPLLGFSLLSTLAGMIYGFPGGWPILAAGSILGSFCSFIVFRYLLQNQAHKLIKTNKKLEAFAEILREDSSFVLLILIRLCPLPYSLSNGALAGVPELPAFTFFMASLVSSPKLFVHVFAGHQLKALGDESSSRATKIVKLLSIVVTGLALSATTIFIYKKMQEKLNSYYQRQHNAPHEDAIFGDFNGDIESGTNLELASTDYDADNFIIADDTEDIEETSLDNSKSTNDNK